MLGWSRLTNFTRTGNVAGGESRVKNLFTCSASAADDCCAAVPARLEDKVDRPLRERSNRATEHSIHLLQRVDFDQGDAGRVVQAAHNRGVAPRSQRADDR